MSNEFLEYPRRIYYIDAQSETPTVLFTTAERVCGVMYEETGATTDGITFESADGTLVYGQLTVPSGGSDFKPLKFYASQGLRVSAVEEVNLTVFVVDLGPGEVTNLEGV